MKEQIDWQQLAQQIGTLTKEGEAASSDYARQALELILGEENLKLAVEHYVAWKPGHELIRAVLWQLHPWSAMQHCYRIYKTDAVILNRKSALQLLIVVGDRRSLPWVSEFLDDPDTDIQIYGIRLLDQLLFSQLIFPDEAEELLFKAAVHKNPEVGKAAAAIRDYLDCRKDA